MQMKWWGVSITCTACKGETTLQSVGYSADGELMFTFNCLSCKKTLPWKIFASKLAYLALRADMESIQPIEVKTFSSTLEIPSATLTDKDKDLEREWGIDPGEVK